MDTTAPEELPKTVPDRVDRILAALKSSIQDQGFTQREVQEALGWGRTYLSQLFRRQKVLRIDQVVSVLHVIGIHPGVFFAEVFGPPPEIESDPDPDPVTLPPEPPYPLDTPEFRVLLTRIVAEVLEQKLRDSGFESGGRSDHGD